MRGKSTPAQKAPGLTEQQILELMENVARLNLEEVSIETEGFSVRVVGRRSPLTVATQAAPGPPSSDAVPLPSMAPPPAAAPAAPAEEKAAPAPEDDPRLVKITSPMIGTYYSAPAPDSPAFVQVGDRVDNETVLCIIEAMKLMNEIKAEMRGVVKRIFVENGQPVEYGQPIVAIEPG